MDCRQVQEIMKGWEKSGVLDENNIPQLEVHIDSCDACKMKFSVLLPFIFRDGSGEAGLRLGLDDAVLNLKEIKKKLSKPEKKRKYVPLLLGAIILGVVALMIGGVFYLFQPGLEQNTVRFEFTLFAPDAKSVELMGDFTEWEKNKIRMKGPDSKGVFRAEIQLEKGKIYKYNFIINEKQTIADPNSTFEVDDGFGGISSLLQL
jgi:hypothetical protein